MPQIPDTYESLIYGGAALVGLLSCFAGYKLFKGMIIAIVALAGAAGLAWLGYQFGDQPMLWSVGGLIMGAILGGVMAMSLYSLAVGTLAALFVATTLLPWVQGYEAWMQLAILGGACLFAALLATALTNLMIQLASAMIGGFLLVHAAMYFISGETIHRAAEGDDGWVLYLDLDLTTAGIALVVGLVGFLVQRRAATRP